jgi:hypothetical protein
MSDSSTPPTPQELFAELLSDLLMCPHERHLHQVSLLLLAAVNRQGGRMEFSDEELMDASKRMLSIHSEGLRRTTVAESLIPPLPSKEPTHPPAPGAH